MVGTGRQLTSLRHCSRACGGIYHAGSKCKPNLCQKVYYFSRPKYFFLCVNSRITSKILKLVLDRVSKFEWIKQTILFFEIQSSGFVFLNR